MNKLTKKYLRKRVRLLGVKGHKKNRKEGAPNFANEMGPVHLSSPAHCPLSPAPMVRPGYGCGFNHMHCSLIIQCLSF